MTLVAARAAAAVLTAQVQSTMATAAAVVAARAEGFESIPEMRRPAREPSLLQTRAQRAHCAARPRSMPAYRQSPQSCSLCPQLARASCLRCGQPLCDAHRHTKKERCDSCENGFNSQLAVIGKRPPVLRGQSWRNIPLDIVVLALFLVSMPALLAVDLVLFALSLAFHGLWEFHAVRTGYPWLASKERRMWERRRRELRRDFLAEEPKLLGS